MALKKLVEYLDNDNDCDGQYTVPTIMSLYKGFLKDGDEGYCHKTVVNKLKHHYGSGLVVTSEKGKETILTMLDASNQILRENLKKCTLTNEDIIDMAATLINDEIRSTIYDLTTYPKMINMFDDTLTQPLTKRFFNVAIKTKAKVKPHTVERRRIAISHALISAERPRSFISPLLLGVAVYINTRLESRECVDILNSLAFCEDYTELLRLFDSLIPKEDSEEYGVLLHDFLNFVFDNADLNIRTLTGLGTWHCMGGIVAGTPSVDNQAEPLIPRAIKIREAEQLYKFASIPITQYKRQKNAGLKKVKVGPLSISKDEPKNLLKAKMLDSFWLVSFPLLKEISTAQPWRKINCPNWSGYMQSSVTGGSYNVSDIQILPFINLDPKKSETVFSAMDFAQNQMSKLYPAIQGHKKTQGAITLDQNLHVIFDDIWLANRERFNQIFLRLGGFHKIMSYMGGIGFIMRGSGLEELFSTVYASNTVEHMMTGKAYSRALRGHMLVSTAMVKMMLEERPGCLTGVSKEHIRTLHTYLIEGSCTSDQMLNNQTAKQISSLLEDLVRDLKSESSTAALWISYIVQTQMMRLFIFAERTGDFDLHLYCVERFIPIFHASNHFPYAKSTRRYLDTMRDLPNIMSKEQYDAYVKGGFFTIRRSHRFWSGIFSDQTIEQVLMRTLKAPGGLAHGRGVTDSTQAKFVHAIPKCIPICNALEDFCGVHSTSSDQHRDLRAATEAKDGEHCSVFYGWLSQNSPFQYKDVEGLVDVATGVIADPSANAHEAYSRGLAIANSLNDIAFSEVKLKHSHAVVSIKAARDRIKVRGQDVEYNFDLLFARATCVSSPQEMKDNLCYEFAKTAPAMFEKGLMRKNTKSVLAALIKEGHVLDIQAPNPQEQFVIDGGKFLQCVPWPDKAEKYDDVLDQYIKYAIQNYPPHSHFVMDGYEDPNSVKVCEQKQRIKGNVARTIIFDEQTKLSKFSKTEFFNNSINKGRFVKILSIKLRQAGYEVTECEGDADYDIAEAALTQSSNNLVCLDASDTDILVKLVSAENVSENLVMKLNTGRYKIASIRRSLKQNVVKYVLVAHAMSGCDSTSALFRRGKTHAFKAIDNEKDLSFLDVFKSKDSTHDQIASAGEKFLLIVYNAPQTTQTLDDLRYANYKKQVNKKSLTSATGLELRALPPTSDSAKYQSYRAYYQIQKWLGNYLNPTDWGWMRNEYLIPVVKDKAAAPDKILKLISCGCKQGCHKTCMCRKAGMFCTILCSGCNGRDCTNLENVESDF